MKINLTPQLAYLIGIWKTRRTKEGIGIFVKGDELKGIFMQTVLKLGLTTPEKLQVEEAKVYFYHSAYLAFFEKVVAEELERFKYKNEYAANYLAGMFDAVGGETKEGSLFLENGTREDEMLLLRLNFRAKKMGKRIFIYSADEFWAFVKPYSKFFARQ